MDKYMVIVVQAFEAETPTGQLLDLTSLELMEDDPQKALERAKSLITKKHYRVAQIIENYVKS